MRTSLLSKSTSSILKGNYEIAGEIGRHVVRREQHMIKRTSGSKPWLLRNSHATFAMSPPAQQSP